MAHARHIGYGDGDDPSAMTLTLGPEQLVIRRRYEAASIFNDFLVAGWFLVGSILFLYPDWEPVGVWLFIIGSAQFMLRPTLRLAHRIHLRHVPPSRWEM
ncbi:hypothetical protein KBTX_02495 [wastewater metagenome]|uniref:YrhK domain-containing protein n=2 Tax=unclassified sequences TaxID=12908 RepID=A0A5B8RH09_9ZZZZ|nr:MULTISPECIES: YrhK family protein [Arhodomonas]MCS4504474.1 YrhK family protein [Arhodomonas aquaeolei]QEA06165.1 hypothetical protein KBTEX_02495 [uncultured organism]